MKVKTDFGITGYSGKAGRMVYYMIPGCTSLITRSCPDKIREAAQHGDYRIIGKNLKSIQPSTAYKNDFKVYTALYRGLANAEISIVSWHNLYIRMLWAMQRQGLADLKTITKQQIITENLPCRSVRAAVEAGFLAEVLNYQSLDNDI